MHDGEFVVQFWCSFGAVLVKFWNLWWCIIKYMNFMQIYDVWFMKLYENRTFFPNIWCIFEGLWKWTKSAPKVHQNMVQFWCSFGAVSNYHINLSKFQQNVATFHKQFQKCTKSAPKYGAVLVQFWCSFKLSHKFIKIPTTCIKFS